MTFSKSFRKRNKYRAVKTRCHNPDHPPHDSKLEAEYCDELHLMKKSGYIKTIRSQEPFNLVVNGKHICKHIVDFYVQDKYWKWSVKEVKGAQTPEWKLKKKLFEALNPDIKYDVIFKVRKR